MLYFLTGIITKEVLKETVMSKSKNSRGFDSLDTVWITLYS